MSQSLSQQSTQAIIGIAFGIVMFVLTLITLWQGYRQKCRSTGAMLTPGQPYAITSDANVAELEDGTYHRPTRGHRAILSLITFFHISNNGARPLPTIEFNLSTPFHQLESSPESSNSTRQLLSTYSTIVAPSITTPNSDAGDIGCQNTILLE
ncbi:hypothetical protein JMJ35_009644 [Cladonia borealis]|uniref:Uncharacterized protein n=1 Tax=Cladonia borealis TaxID=184061 RepID=A0AA39QTG6_9LECA|nr:hypothetical protein JMJ35_009644 [Cladonia borealis]